MTRFRDSTLAGYTILLPLAIAAYPIRLHRFSGFAEPSLWVRLLRGGDSNPIYRGLFITAVPLLVLGVPQCANLKKH